jgi:hypothetical protein
VRFQITAFFAGLGFGAGVGVLVMWLVNDVFAAWLTRVVGMSTLRVSWTDVACLALMFAFGAAGGAHTLAGLYYD